MIEDALDGMYGSGLGIVCPIDQASNAGLRCGAGAHSARLNGYVQVAISQPIISERGSSLAQSDDLSVRCRVGVDDVAIKPAAYYSSFANHYRADRNFARFERALGSSQSLLDPELVMLSG
jgi:hypothetical protein